MKGKADRLLWISASLALGGLVGWVLLSTVVALAAEKPPYVESSPAVQIMTLTKPRLPERFALVAAAFTVPETGTPITLTLHTARFPIEAQLAYQAFGSTAWQRLPMRVDDLNQVWQVSNAPAGSYAIVIVTAMAALPANAIIVDDLDAGFQPYGPSANWQLVSSPRPTDYYLDHARWTANTYNTVENWAVWHPPVQLDGPYEVYAFVPGNHADTTHASYRIQYAGLESWQAVNQSTKWTEWVSLGVYTFTGETQSYVSLTDVTYENYGQYMVAFDAIAFVPRSSRIYLPLVMRNWPPPPPRKQRTGIHLGNRNDDWRPSGAPADFLSLLDPEVNEDGIYPAAVVILSSYLYNIERNAIAPCNVERATVRVPSLYAYLQRASHHGTQVVIRIHPSPGNFSDWDTYPYKAHYLSADSAPAGEHYCWSDSWPESPDKPYGFQYFRAYADITDEMGAIHTLNVANGWSEAGFIPANEPNTEWYSFETVPEIYRMVTWQAMNAYFVALYDYAHLHYPGVSVFTPAMAQTAFGETRHIQTCDPMSVEGTPGYTWMEETYKNKNDGYTWNNYYWYGQESWDDCPNGQHVSYFFPLWLQGELDFYTTKPRFIIETDLAAPQQMSGGSSLRDKDADVNLTTTSLQQFTRAEQRADVVIFWLLTNANNSDAEFNWHKAYNDDGSVRPWFEDWWLTSEE